MKGQTLNLRLLRWGTFLLCVVLLLYGVFRPEPPQTLFAHSDKVGHLLAFMVLGLSARWALSRANGVLLWGGLLLAAVSLEVAQHQVQPLRFFSVQDIAANLLGVVLAWGIYSVARRLHRSA